MGNGLRVGTAGGQSLDLLHKRSEAQAAARPSGARAPGDGEKKAVVLVRMLDGSGAGLA